MRYDTIHRNCHGYANGNIHLTSGCTDCSLQRLLTQNINKISANTNITQDND